MVKKAPAVYLLIGPNSPAKDAKIKKLREEFLSQEVEQFNLDRLYAKELDLKTLQERLATLPVKAKRRIVIIKDAEDLKEEIKEFILRYIEDPYPYILLILDVNFASVAVRKGRVNRTTQERFIDRILNSVNVLFFKENPSPDTFMLSHQIGPGKSPHAALRLLNQLLEKQERPERILGGLRYAWQKDIVSPRERKRRLKALLDCDREIKTSQLKPRFALEKLVLSLCCLGKPMR
ncbi:MAG: hypothetical protein NC928_05095 [Candidatus Omnitrophica bacterium]|nr:hypothetical protein [Candidatus Omnitrophota bacterium]